MTISKIMRRFSRHIICGKFEFYHVLHVRSMAESDFKKIDQRL